MGEAFLDVLNLVNHRALASAYHIRNPANRSDNAYHGKNEDDEEHPCRGRG